MLPPPGAGEAFLETAAEELTAAAPVAAAKVAARAMEGDLRATAGD